MAISLMDFSRIWSKDNQEDLKSLASNGSMSQSEIDSKVRKMFSNGKTLKELDVAEDKSEKVKLDKGLEDKINDFANKMLKEQEAKLRPISESPNSN